jgi:histidine ammonia-lyase
MKSIALDGTNLSIEDIFLIVNDQRVSVDVAKESLEKVRHGRKFLEKEFTRKIIYGVNTGFGPMASHIIAKNELIALQKNLIRGHAMGMGKPLPSEYVLAAMVVRLNTLTKGYSGVSVELVEHLKTFINKRIMPIVPEHGGVGASGDLVQLAHIALALIGEGDVIYRGKRQRAISVMRSLRIKPYALKPKEGLALINGTSMMAGIASLLCVEARRLISLSLKNGAFALESVGAFSDGISQELHAVRPHRGQSVVAETLRGIVSSSQLLRPRETLQKKFAVTNTTHTIPEHVQEVYSLRCIPQVVGPIFDMLAKTWGEVTIEINAVTDNPVVDAQAGMILHGGNFHGDYIAASIDQLKASLVKLTMLSERRINFFMNAKVNNFFPPFMNLKKPGLTMGLQGLQFVATSTTARSQSLAFPHHVHSIPTNADNQDVVSMGTDATLIAAEVIENAYIVMSIELVALAQAADFLRQKKKYSLASQTLLQDVRNRCAAIVEDREAYGDLDKVVQYAKQSTILDMAW